MARGQAKGNTQTGRPETAAKAVAKGTSEADASDRSEEALTHANSKGLIRAAAPEDIELAQETDNEEPAGDVLVGELVGPGDEDPIALSPDHEDPEDNNSDETREAGLDADLAPVPVERAPLASVRDPVARFVAEARSYPRLSEDEERRLVARAQNNDQSAGRRLVVHNLRLVITIAYQYRRAWTNMLDLFQEGSVGLVEAVSRWDPALGTRFGTYAAYWIRAYILRFLMRNARMIHVGNTRAGRKLFFRLNKERAKLQAAGFDPTTKLLASTLNVSEKDVEEVAGTLDAAEVSLAPRPDAEGLSLDEKISAPSQPSPEDAAARSLLADSVRGAMDRFAAQIENERELAIWQEHLAASEEPVSLGELGKRFGVSKQRMGQIADRLKKRFRTMIVEEMGDDLQMSWQRDI